MNQPSFEHWEARIQTTAATFRYPPTPDIAAAVRRRLSEPAAATKRRQLAWAVALVLVLLGGLLAVPRVRAAVLEFLQVGAIRVLPPATPVPARTAPAAPTPTAIASLRDLAGETTLAEAEERAGFDVRLPAYPPDLCPPDRVFLQNLGGGIVVSVWLDPLRAGRVRLSLHQLSSGTAGFKGEPAPRAIRETSVHGQRALWTEGPHILQLEDGRFEMRRLVEGNVLIWTEGDITYRLESDLPLEQAVRIAESLR